MRITYEYALVGDSDDTVRRITAGRPSVYAAEKHFGVGLIGAFGKGDVSLELLDWILHHAVTRAIQKGDVDGVALVWSEFADGELEGALDWCEAVDISTGNPR